MNLAAYDTIKEINYLGHWIDPRYRRLYSRNLPYYKFYSFAKKYNPIKQVTDFYIILHNNLDTDLTIHSVIVDKGVIKLYLKDIWDETILKNIKDITNVDLILEDKQEDCSIYFIDL